MILRAGPDGKVTLRDSTSLVPRIDVEAAQDEMIEKVEDRLRIAELIELQLVDARIVAQSEATSPREIVGRRLTP